MNYVIEDNLDFYKLLNEEIEGDEAKDTDKEKREENKCLISHTPLTHNFITLPCMHKFNYLPLYTELCLHSKKKMCCPYCRLQCNKLIPFIPLSNVKKVLGVNYPLSKCMPAPICTIVLKKGKSKGTPCGNPGVTTDHGTFCIKHPYNPLAEENIWTVEMDEVSKEKGVVELKALLKAKGLKTSGLKKDLVKRYMLSQKTNV